MTSEYYTVKRRDQIAAWLCNFVLAWVASDYYRQFIGGVMAYGLDAAARDVLEDRESPPFWRDLLLSKEQNRPRSSAASSYTGGRRSEVEDG